MLSGKSKAVVDALKDLRRFEGSGRRDVPIMETSGGRQVEHRVGLESGPEPPRETGGALAVEETGEPAAGKLEATTGGWRGGQARGRGLSLGEWAIVVGLWTTLMGAGAFLYQKAEKVGDRLDRALEDTPRLRDLERVESDVERARRTAEEAHDEARRNGEEIRVLLLNQSKSAGPED
ncbi:MAG: hypothetical protein SYC29_14165 [Planctomycetota bacterium]|nr:hypothetical protein [Planctomycetota bacterium]